MLKIVDIVLILFDIVWGTIFRVAQYIARSLAPMFDYKTRTWSWTESTSFGKHTQHARVLFKLTTLDAYFQGLFWSL